MTLAPSGEALVIRTERGLTIAGTRITLYDVMDYLTEHYPAKFIRAMLGLTNEQVCAAIAYIEAHRPEVEAEYQLVLQETEELKQYYEAQNRERIARITAKPPKPGTEAIVAKLHAAEARFVSQV
ncbi:DUF433 domain-containing protein [Alkalinema pantanalense CENA528]|uniref:DUF433 domain-containing protein n=1 Tax=Alkalinema pantanalense TaxID=1620705 RepID=UPI003D7016F2